MRAIEYFKRLFSIFYLYAAGIIIEDTKKRIEGGSVVPLKITSGKEAV